MRSYLLNLHAHHRENCACNDGLVPVGKRSSIDDYLRTWLMQNSSTFRTWVRDYVAGEPKHVNIAVSTPADGGTATVTPWASASSMTGNTTARAYSTSAATAVGGFAADATFLGRYGVVRNNWYTVNITSVTH